MVHFKLNSTKGRKPVLSKASQKNLEKFNWADYRLYNFFKERLYRQANDIGMEKVLKIKNEILKMSEDLKKECSTPPPSSKNEVT